MKKVSAVLIILAVLNPLCCYWTYGESEPTDTAKEQEQACCETELDSQKSKDKEDHAANSAHEEGKASAIASESKVVVPELPLIPYRDLYKEPHDFKYLRNSMEAFEKSYKANQSISRWVGGRTDCVERL
jgi:hypothetical protein